MDLRDRDFLLERHKGNQHVVRDNVELAAVPDPLIYWPAM